MVDINEIYKSNSEYLKAEDIGANMWTMTISATELKEFTDGSRKVVLTFHEFDKVMPLNVTNARAIAELYGHNSDAWIGQQILLFTMPVDYNGKMVQAIRVRAPMQQQQPAQARQQAPQPRQASPQPQKPNAYQSANGGTARSFQAPINQQPAGAREFAPIDDSEIPF